VRSVEFHPDAQNEFISAAHFYEGQTEGLGLDFIATVQRAYERLREFPRSGAQFNLVADSGVFLFRSSPTVSCIASSRTASISSPSCTFTGGHATGGHGSERGCPTTRSTGPLARIRSPRPADVPVRRNMNARSGRIQIRKAQPIDLSVMHAIRRDAILEIKSGLDANGRQAWADRRSADFYAGRVAVGDAIIASLADDDIGWGSSTANRITAVYVRSSCGLFGVGRALMSALEDTIQARGHACSTLESSPNALGFYAKLGYAATGVPQADGAVPMARRLRSSE